MAASTYLVLDKTTNIVTQVVSVDSSVTLEILATQYPNNTVMVQPAQEPGVPTIRAGFMLYNGAWFMPMPASVGPTGTIQVTKLQFRKLFTFTEQVALDNFNSDANLTATQKAQMQTVVNTFADTQLVDLSDPVTKAMLDIVVSVGYLTNAREIQILSAQAAPTS